ncbi:MAG: hypothetical protein ABI587_00290 [Gemmatimonadales bacterium]
MSPGPGTGDTGERAQFLKLFVRLAIPGTVLLAIGEAMALGRGWISPVGFFFLLLLDLPMLYLLALLIFRLIDSSASGFTTMVLAGGNLTPEPAHSGMESLVARGFYPEAAEQFRAHLITAPNDHAARFKLADLYRRHLADPLAAERLYLEVRNGRVSPREEMFAGNMLIELYYETGRQDRQIVELARFAQRWRGTAGGRSAAQALKEMKQEMPEA